jgi:iron(III) transport system ATP-binding protein
MHDVPLLELRNLSKSYQTETRIIDQVSLRLRAGEIFALLGESGAGKSTLLQLAANLTNPDQGEVWLDGEKLPLPSDLLIPGHPDIKIVHQDYQLSPSLSVRENIRYALRYYEPDYRNARIEELLQLCQLWEVAERPTKLLSGGEKQRTAIARALAEEARILLLDEPFAHLDLPNNRRLSDTIRTLVAPMEAACLIVTHHAADALGLAQRIGILRQGRLIQVGTPEEIYHHPIDTYVAQLSGVANIVERTWLQAQWGLALGHPLPEGQLLLRPEQLALSLLPLANAPAAVLRWKFFEGSRYRVGLELAGKMLEAYTSGDLNVGQTVFLALAD